MPIFKLHLRQRGRIEPDDIELEYRGPHHAYLEACKAVPDVARELLIEGQDLIAAAFLICDRHGQQLM